MPGRWLTINGGGIQRQAIEQKEGLCGCETGSMFSPTVFSALPLVQSIVKGPVDGLDFVGFQHVSLLDVVKSG